MTTPESAAQIKAKLNLETSRIAWRDLQVYYARGHVVQVSDRIDLLQVAVELTRDNKTQFEQWMATGDVGEVTPALAQSWYDHNTELWAVVIAPWVLVQDQQPRSVH